MKEPWCFEGNCVSLHFEYEHPDALNQVQWLRAHGNEYREFGEAGFTRRREVSANDYLVQESERRYRD